MGSLAGRPAPSCRPVQCKIPTHGKPAQRQTEPIVRFVKVAYIALVGADIGISLWNRPLGEMQASKALRRGLEPVFGRFQAGLGS